MQSLRLESCTIDLGRGEVRRRGQVQHLTTKEIELLTWLVGRAGQAVSRAELLREVWGFRGRTPNTRAPDFTVMRLRSKIEQDPEHPRHVLTVHGAGYRFVPLSDDDPVDHSPAPEAPVDPLFDDEDTTEHVLPAPHAGRLPSGARYQSGLLIGRAEEIRIARALLEHPGGPVVVHGPSGIGKTWLLDALTERPGASDRAVRLDLRHLDRATLADGRRLLLRLLADLCEALDDAEHDVALPDVALPEGDPARALTRALERLGLAATPGRLFLVLDHVDEARHMADPSALYALLRAWCERVRPPWDRLRLLLGLSTEPALLVSEPHLSPFNLSPPIRLTELSRPEVERLVETYDLHVDEHEIDGLIALTGGHPSLCRGALFRAASTGAPLHAVLTASTREGGCFWDHQERRARALLENPALRDGLMAAISGVGGPVDPAAARRLEAAGLLARREGTWTPRNGLVAQLVARI